MRFLAKDKPPDLQSGALRGLSALLLSLNFLVVGIPFLGVKLFVRSVGSESDRCPSNEAQVPSDPELVQFRGHSLEVVNAKTEDASGGK